MRRRIIALLPIFLIALLVQICAPIGAHLAMAAASDPLFAAPICSHTALDADEQPAPADTGPAHHAACPLCGWAHAGLAPLPEAIAVWLAPQAPHRRISLAALTALPSARILRDFAQPRAPPAVS